MNKQRTGQKLVEINEQKRNTTGLSITTGFASCQNQDPRKNHLSLQLLHTIGKRHRCPSHQNREALRAEAGTSVDLPLSLSPKNKERLNGINLLMCLRILLSWKADTFISLKSISLEVLFEQGRADSHSPTSRKQQQQQGLPPRDDHASGLQPQLKSRSIFCHRSRR